MIFLLLPLVSKRAAFSISRWVYLFQKQRQYIKVQNNVQNMKMYIYKSTIKQMSDVQRITDRNGKYRVTRTQYIKE